MTLPARLSLAALALAVAVASNPGPARAAAGSVPVRLVVDGRPVLRATAQSRGGVVYVELGGIVRTFSGLVIFDGPSATVSVGNRVAIFTIGSGKANLDGEVVPMGGKTFKDASGDWFVPLPFFATRVARAKMSIRAGGTVADITSIAGASAALPTQTP